MFKYEGAKCPICHAYLMEDDDIVVCPDCGAPHHRDCWKSLGHCGCEELHREGKSWTLPRRAEEPTPGQGVQKLCPACHAPNDPNALFCSRCGTPMQQNGPAPGAPGGPPPFGGFQTIVIDPLGGVAPDEEIGGVQAKDLALVVGQNSAYYLPRFREMSRGNKRFFPNFSAFLFDIPWMFFRKMVWPAIAVLLVDLALNIPNIWYIVRSLTEENLTASSFSTQFLTIMSICSFVQMAFRLVICLFANKFYMKQCVRVARELRETHPGEEAFAEQAKKRGGVWQAAVYICSALLLLFYMGYSFVLLNGMR